MFQLSNSKIEESDKEKREALSFFKKYRRIEHLYVDLPRQYDFHTRAVAHLAERTGVYIIKKDNRTLYIGQSVNILKRTYNNIYKHEQINFPDCSIQGYYVEDKIDRDLVETFLINTQHPPLNVQRRYTY